MHIPMSAEQEGTWLNDQLQDGASRFVEPWVHRLRGPVDQAAIASALSTVVSRHESLRSRLTTVDGRPVQIVVPATPIRLATLDVSEEDLHQVLRAVVQRPVHLDQPPLLNATVLRIADDDLVLAITIHHAVFDGWSLGLLSHELSEFYREAVTGIPANVPEITVQPSQYALAQHDADLSQDLGYWRSALEGAPVETTVPADRPRPPVLGAAGGQIPLVLDAQIANAVRQYARQARTTPFVVLMSALMALVGRLSGQPETVIGTPVSRRTDLELEPMIACLTDVMPIRGRPERGVSFGQLVKTVAQDARKAITHRNVSYSSLVREFATERTLSRSPLFQIVLTVDDAPPPVLAFPGVTAESMLVHDGTAKYDLFLDLMGAVDGFAGSLEYSAALFDQATAERLVSRWRVLLADALAHPDRTIGELEVLPDSERAELRAWSKGGPAVESPLAHEAFAAQARSVPDQVALIGSGRTLSYRELDEASDAVAAGLPGRRVAVFLDRSVCLPLAVLATLKAGASCLVLDPSYPAERIAFMLQDSASDTVITRRSMAYGVPDGPWRLVFVDEPGSEFFQPQEVTPDDIAYVVYTSGSTGRPKGIAMPHRSLANLIAWQTRRSACGQGTRTLQAATPGFDVAFQEILATWAAGGTLVVADDAPRDPERVLDLIDHHQVNRVFLGFFALQNLAEYAAAAGRSAPSLREVVSSGEQVHVTPAIRKFFAELTSASLENQYGPSETHVVTAERLSGDPSRWPARPSIGRPIDGAEVFVLDEDLRQQPIGVTGEICAGGAPVAAGYLGHASLVRDRFVPLYRTGDLGRVLPDGRIEFLGRADHQVKVRGFRVELGEVESALKEVAGVHDAVATSHNGRLVAYYIGNPRGIRETLLKRLPSHMVPSQFVAVPAFPLTGSGKVDRAALAAPDPVAAVAPVSPLHRQIAAMWADVLEVGGIGMDDDFFTLGGDSLLATRAALRLRDELAADLPVAAMFSHPTVSSLASLISGTTPAATSIDVAGLADDIRPVPPVSLVEPQEILLTGAGGFLGSYLLRSLMASTTAKVHCLVRDTALRTRLARLGLWESRWENRITVLAGDLGQPRLGLSESIFDTLAHTVDVIYHAGADVNLTSPFTQLARPNIAGTEEILRLAARYRTVPVHHVSTAGVHIGPGFVRASDPLPPKDKLDNGYALSKWHAEQLVAQARARGLPVSVYRPTRIAADSLTGACQTNDFMWLLLKACVQAGAAPAGVGTAFDLVPVEYVSAAIVELSRRAPGVYHLASERRVTLQWMVDELRALDYRIADVSPAEWLQRIAADQGNAAYPLVSLLDAELVAAGSEGDLLVSAAETRQALSGTNIAPAPVDRTTFRVGVSYLIRTGFLTPPN